MASASPAVDPGAILLGADVVGFYALFSVDFTSEFVFLLSLMYKVAGV